jgi:hypothetical protein
MEGGLAAFWARLRPHLVVVQEQTSLLICCCPEYVHVSELAPRGRLQLIKCNGSKDTKIILVSPCTLFARLFAMPLKFKLFSSAITSSADMVFSLRALVRS